MEPASNGSKLVPEQTFSGAFAIGNESILR